MGKKTVVYTCSLLIFRFFFFKILFSSKQSKQTKMDACIICFNWFVLLFKFQFGCFSDHDMTHAWPFLRVKYAAKFCLSTWNKMMFFRTNYLFWYWWFFHSIFELRFKDLIWRKILSLNVMNVYLKFSRSVFGIVYHWLGKKIPQHSLKET